MSTSGGFRLSVRRGIVNLRAEGLYTLSVIENLSDRDIQIDSYYAVNGGIHLTIIGV